MRTASLFVLLLAAPALTSPPVDFRASIDAEISRLSIAQPGTEVEPELEPADEGSLPWRLLGFANYAAAGNIAASQFYREERTSSWNPNINDVTTRLAVHGAAVETANEASDLLRRRGNTSRAWMVRIGYLLAASYVAQDNYRNGWRRR